MTLEDFLDRIGYIRVDESAELMIKVPISHGMKKITYLLGIADVQLENGVLVVDLEDL